MGQKRSFFIVAVQRCKKARIRTREACMLQTALCGSCESEHLLSLNAAQKYWGRVASRRSWPSSRDTARRSRAAPALPKYFRWRFFAVTRAAAKPLVSVPATHIIVHMATPTSNQRVGPVGCDRARRRRAVPSPGSVTFVCTRREAVIGRAVACSDQAK